VTAATDPGVDVAMATRLLADWGFLARPDLPEHEGPAYLLVALRREPTLRHYDPEVVDYWATEHDRGVRRAITLASAMPIDGPFSWGPIQIVDRLHVTNEYLTFGGSLRAERVEGAVIVVFTSPVPLLRRGGHSQGWDPGADSLGAHFGRFLAAVDCIAGFEAAAARADPISRYATFLVGTTEHYRQATALPRPQRELLELSQREARRVQQLDGDAWLRGVALWQRIVEGTTSPTAAVAGEPGRPLVGVAPLPVQRRSRRHRDLPPDVPAPREGDDT
jgi:hypothetical protein